MQLENVILRPLLTEKSTKLTEKNNRYAFAVNLKATKISIRKAVEKFYDVRVLDVKTAVLPGERKRVGFKVVKSSKRKKAYVRLEEGQKIEFFKEI